MVYSLPYSFAPGEVARPQEVNANFNAIINQIEEINTTKANIDLSNISSDGMDNIKNSSLSKNIGELVFSTIPLTDAGLHLLDGSIILSEGIYSDFCKHIRKLYYENEDANYFTTESDWQSCVNTYGECGKFVYDTENNSVRLPKINGIIESTANIETLGELIKAGLPNHTHTRGSMNITGTVRGTSLIESMTATGVFYNAGNNSNQAPSEGQGTCQTIGFDASRKWTGSTSEAEYGDNSIENSSTVQPQTIKYLIYIVVANSSKTDIQVDIDLISADLNNKADCDLSNISTNANIANKNLTNITDTAKILISGMGMPSDSYIDLTLGASGSTYTAPANGWFVLKKIAGTANTYAFFTNQTNGMTTGDAYTLDWQTAYLYMPVKKGDIIKITYTITGNTDRFRFIYAQGSESEFV